MAKEDDLDIGAEEAGGSKKKLIIIIAIAALLLIGGGVAAWFFLSGGEEEENAEQAAQEQAAQEQEVLVEKGEVAYHDMSPVFVANMVGKPRMLQVGLQVRTYYPALTEFLKHNDPALRHSILNLLSTQDGQALKTLEGKDQLREQIKEAINKLIDRYKGPGEVDEVLFSSFVMQ
jgi:flagellar FliL protein